MAPSGYGFTRRRRSIASAGLSHSDTCGSMPVDGSPQLVAVFRVLHRLLMPRHPSCARIRFARYFYLAQSRCPPSPCGYGGCIRCNSLESPASAFQRSTPARFRANGRIVYQIPARRAIPQPPYFIVKFAASGGKRGHSWKSPGRSGPGGQAASAATAPAIRRTAASSETSGGMA